MNAHEVLSLGKSAEIASKQAVSDPRRAERYRLQNLAARLLPKERVSECLRRVAPLQSSVDVLYNSSQRTARYNNLVVCNRVWTCPVCAARITEQRRRDLTFASVNADFSPLLLTFTLRHKLGDKLPILLSALLESIRAFKPGAFFKDLKKEFLIAGSVRSLEVTYSDRHGWHPHSHMLLFLYSPLVGLEAKKFEAKVKVQWLKVLARYGFDATWENGLDVRTADTDVRDYIAKWGHEPIKTGWSPEHEVVKSPTKRSSMDGKTPLQLLADYGDGDRRAGRLFVEYARCFKGRNQLVWSRGLRALLGMDEDESAVASDEILSDVEAASDQVILTSFSRDEWSLLVNLDLRSDLLDVASSGDSQKLNAWLASATSGYRFYVYHLNEIMDSSDGTCKPVEILFSWNSS